jgi:nicotinamidase-related amidase
MEKPDALLIIDVQMDFVARRDAGFQWGNPQADHRIAALLAGFRAAAIPVIHVHHHDPDVGSDFHKDAPGAAVQPCAAPLPGEQLVIKHGSSAFIGTGLEQGLRDAGVQRLVIAGGAANYCVESTARMAGNLGFATTVVGDALLNFHHRLRDGRLFPATDVLAMTLANLDGEFARIAATDQVLAEISA